MFNLTKSKIYPAVKWEMFFASVRLCKKIFLLTLVISFIWFFITQTEWIGGLCLLSLVVFVICKILEAFFISKLKKPVLKVGLKQALLGPEEYNIVNWLGFEAVKAVFKSFKLAQSKNLKLNSTILFYFLLKDNPEIEFIFSRALLDFEAIKIKLEQGIRNVSEKSFQGIILDSLKIAYKRNHQIVQMGDLLITLSKIDPVFKRILIEADLSAEDIENLVSFQEFLKEKQARKKRFWEMENLLKLGSVGRDWAAGYTITLDQYSIDWTNVVKKRGYEEVIGHQEEIKRLEMVLARATMNNALLVGEPGTGRKSIIHALSKKVLFGQSLAVLNYKRIVELDLAALLARAETEEIAESLLEIIFKEAVLAGNIILIIDGFPNFVAGERRPGTIDISGVLLKYLKFPQLLVIGICSFSGFHKYVEQRPSILNLFEKIEVLEISERETILVLENQIPFYEAKYKKFISYPAIRDTVRYCAKYLPALPFPKKAIDLLDEVMVYVSRYVRETIVLPKHVAKIVTEKTKIPVGEIEIKEREVLLNLEELIHKRIINQDEAVNQVSTAMRRTRAEITIRKGPIGAFLFLGSTGVGKTETSKALAEIYFGSEDRMIRLDMSEFQDIKDIPRLIGAPASQGLLTTKIRERPFSLILLDEIEKAHPDILNLFLQVIDEGHITDGVGRRVSFKNSIIIATSNAGAKIIWEDIKLDKKLDIVKEDLLAYLFEKAIFRPEFINRFDAVVVFRPLTKENLLDIAQLMFVKLKKNLTQKYIEFEITQDLKEKIVELGYSPVFGAREMRRVIQDKVENVLARALLSGQLKKGDKIKITTDFKIVKL